MAKAGGGEDIASVAGDGERATALRERVSSELSRHLGAVLAPGLYLVATPIGNLGDITLRALSVLARADVICCEDTRHSGVLLAHFGIRVAMRSFHEHNEDVARERVLAELAEGKRVALISDAGTPLVSDPGYKLVREAAAAGHAVIAIPGASAALAALVASGLPTDAFHFTGFLPAKQTARKKRIEELARVPGTLVLYEATGRVADTLADLAAGLGPRAAAVARELTKLHEEMTRGTLAELAGSFAAREVKGEVVILVAPPSEPGEVTDAAISERLADALETMSLRDASKAVAEDLGVPKARVYDLGLAMKRGSRD
jgi:16S rRNA (cytidine1402-2'-O)-methyltransferase